MPGGRFARRAWADLGGDHELTELIETGSPVPLPSTLPVGELAADSVGLASLAANAVLAARRGGTAGAVKQVRPSGARVAASYRSERLFSWDGRPADVWGRLSGFWQAGDGWVRTHANYPHHAARLRALLGLADDAGRDEFGRVVAERAALDLEERATSAGAIVAAVRDSATWVRHPQARALADRPLAGLRRIGGPAPAKPWPGAGDAPLTGIRVLDLTRVIAGPVATRDLAIAGADVLRVDGPGLPEIAWQQLDTGQGKRTTRLDLASAAGRESLRDLLRHADVVVTGYRPGSLDRFGLAPDALAERYPGIVTGQVSAWDTVGPWRGRRGFDSIVQATIGIAMAESRDGRTPGALPAQALDHSAGHLLAAAIMMALLRRCSHGGSYATSVALAAVGQVLLGTPGDTRAPDGEPRLPTISGTGPAGHITCAPPPLCHENAPGTYAWLGRPTGIDEPRWAEVRGAGS